jgi:hypothetical protein
VRQLTEHDFHGSAPEPADRIKIVATITGFEPNDPQAHPDWFRWGRGVVKWQAAGTGEIKHAAEVETDSLACQIAFAARFDAETLETETVRYFYDGQPDPFDEEAAVVTVPPDLVRQIGFFLVPVGRTWDRTISFGSELFRRVVAYVGGSPAAAVITERDRLRAPAFPLEDDANLQNLVNDINADIRTLFGRPSELKLRVTSTDSDGILEAIMPHFAEGGAIPLPSRRHGSGLISLQTLILLMRFGHMRVANGDGFMMVIEEPELHVPPPLQRKLLRMLQSLATQTIVTTHSPTVAAVPDPQQIALVVNAAGNVSTRRLSNQPLAVQAANPIRSLLLTNRDATVLALMHTTVLIPEGRTDAGWLELFVKCVELGNDANADSALRFANDVGVIPTKDSRCAEVFEHLRGVHPRLACLFDGDPGGLVHTNACCALANPPTLIIRWPNGWTIESVVCWIVEADPAVLAAPDCVAAGLPQDIAALHATLSVSPAKTDEILHATLADAMTASAGSRRRIAHVLTLLADLASGRQVEAARATTEAQPNGVTIVRTMVDAVPGV